MTFLTRQRQNGNDAKTRDRDRDRDRALPRSLAQIALAKKPNSIKIHESMSPAEASAY